MPQPHRDRAVPIGAALLAFALALAQRPGLASSDTKIDLHTDPAGFLADVAAVWSPTGDLGHVQGGQYAGYLFPMGPLFALGRLVGLSPWLMQRLWLGLLLAVAAWGTVRLLDALIGRPRGVAHAVAAVLMILNPYVVVFSARTSVTLLGYAALPWLLLCAYRGLRAPRSWWWPAAFALAIALSGGGVNAAVVAWVLVGPLLLVLYELWAGGVAWAAVRGFAWRAAVATAAASLWWVIPVLVQARHGVDFLQFTEQPGTIWSTSSLSESLRLMGYWVSYIGVGYGGRLRPYFSDGGVLLFSPPVVLAGLLIPALTLAGFVWTRRWRYGPFFLLLVLVGVVTMSVGFPEGTPLRRGANFAYNHVTAVQFLRTTYKAGPLVALGVAALGGAAAAAAASALRRRGRWAAPAAAVAGLALAAVACWPLATGRALDDQLLWERVPQHWVDAADYVDAGPTDRRAVVMPGQLYAYYDWGGTVDPILPTLAERPVAVRNAVPYADLRAVDLLWTVDALVQQRRAVPGQLGPLLDLMSAGTVVSGADDDRTRSGATPPAEAAAVLDELGPPDAAWGPVRAEPHAAGTLGPARPLPRVRAWRRPAARPLVRLEPERGATVVDGSAAGLAAMAAVGALPDRGRLLYAADLSAADVADAAAGGEVVITDSNRRQVHVVSRLAQVRGAVLGAADPVPEDAAVLDPFPERGTDAQTVAVLDGARAIRAPFSPGYPQFPERRPFAAVDGDPGTAWLADRALTPDRYVWELTFDRPRDVPYIDLLPYSDAGVHVSAVEVAGRRFNVRDGWNRLELGLRRASGLQVRIAAVEQPPGPKVTGGLREVRVPGLAVHETLRGPVLAERALAGRDLSHTGLSYVFQRTTGDDPFRRNHGRGPLSAMLVRDRGDGETGLARTLAPPAARAWTADGWATAAAVGPDDVLDGMAGLRAPWFFTGSPRFQGRPGWRASSAFDGTPRPWIGSWIAGEPAWLEWSARRLTTIRSLRLDPPVQRVRRPTVVRLRWDGGRTGPLPVGSDGRVPLPTPARGHTFRLEIVAAAFPPGTSGRARQRRAVGIGELRGDGVPTVDVPRAGALRGGCGDLSGTVGEEPLQLRTTGTIGALDAGRPLRVRSCGPALELPAGATQLKLGSGALAPYILRLRSPAPAGAATAANAPGRVVATGDMGRDRWTGIGLDVREPAWLVTGIAYNAAWRAECDGRELGAPRPVDGAGMAWRVPAGCRRAQVAFGPGGALRVGYAVSAVALLALLLVLILSRPPSGAPSLHALLPATDAPRPLPVGRAAGAAVVLGLAFAFLIAARSAPLIALAVFVVLRRGIGARPLVAAAGVLLVLVAPLLTLLIGVEDRGGFNPEYAQVRIAVHWVVAAALVLLALALGRALSTARAPRAAARAPAPAAAAAQARAP